MNKETLMLFNLSFKDKKYQKFLDEELVNLSKFINKKRFHQDKYHRSLKLIYDNLIYVYLQGQDHKCLIPLNKNLFYKITSNHQNIRREIFKNCLDYLIFKDIISFEKGYKLKNKSSLSKIKFKNIPDKIPVKNINNKFKLHNTNLIFLKDINKNKISYKSNNYLKKQKNLIKRLNRIINNHKILIGKKELPPQFLYRVFNNSSFELGGRFYGGLFQTIKSKEREKITIDGEKIVELDFSCLHVVLLYGIINKQWIGDAYNVPEYKSNQYRKFLKVALNTILNSSSESIASQSIQFGINQKKFPKCNINKLFNSLKNKHQQISHLFFQKELGLQLQYIESSIAADIINNFIIKTKSPILPIHDGFIAKEKYESILFNIMSESFRKYYPDLKIEISKK